MSLTAVLSRFPDRSYASRAAADLIAESLASRLRNHDRASLVVSGGSTPRECFDYLSEKPLDWSRVEIIASDERWVPAGHPDSNQGMIQRNLVVNEAASAQFLPFYKEGIEAGQAPAGIERDLERLAQPFSSCLLGMGEDGHFASLFPDFPGLEGALDPDSEENCVLVKTVGSEHLRISLTLSALLDTDLSLLLFFGEAKLRVFNAASSSEGAYPVEALLAQTRIPIKALWAP